MSLNLTIFALKSVGSTSKSPFFNTNVHMGIAKSYFMRHFSSILRTSNTFSCKQSKFAKTLDSAIIMNSGNTALNRKLFKSTEKISNGDCTITQCDFYQCESSSTGGAINFDCGTSCAYNIIISKTGFMSCKAKKGGAFSVQSGVITLSEVCLSECKADTFPNFDISIKDCTADDIYVEKSNGEHGIKIDCRSSLRYCSVNHTENNDDHNSFLQLICKSSFDSKYVSFEKNTIWKTIVFMNVPSDSSSSQYFNFYHDKSDTVVEAGSGLMLFNYFFIDENCKKCVACNSYSISIRDCSWSGKSESVSEYFSGCVILPNMLTNGVQSIGNMEIKRSGECWLLIPGGSGASIKTAGTYKIFFIIALIVLLIAAILFCCKVGRRKYGLSTDRLAYTL